ncbi:monofunctional biosynthetic peptidoglycan transglycosylase [Thioalkalivibrio sulfidiphilus]|uniref:monofunctional biosynthetic peptidoglycan transglycosylase n=1 Tax=Thioalkalivibrio sulfidiphilus TaxID=1033854 RepID=UPI00039F0582|nr:monofunctional biosynthetic peptidoglycan transglycosylase [Thioalkalivibrio sulfidiphilus]
MRRLLLIILLFPVFFYVLCVAALGDLRFLPPPITGIQVQRVVEQTFSEDPVVWEYRWRRAEQISPHLPRAVVAAEDARFFLHRGFDWEEFHKARETARETARDEGQSMRGASTLTKQLIKNLLFTTHRNPVRKVYEWALTPAAEFILCKDRILELYVNVVEFGPGIYGAEAAARHHYGITAADLSRHQAMGLAAVLPAPLTRRPQAMGWYTEIIKERMQQLGW